MQSEKYFDPDDLRYDKALHYFAKSKYFLEKYEYENAIRYAELAIMADKKMLDVTNATIFPSYLLLAEIYYRDHQIENLRSLIKERISYLVDYDKDTENEVKAKAMIFSSVVSPDLNKAQEQIEQAIRLIDANENNPDVATAYTVLASNLYDQHRYAEAILKYKMAMKIWRSINTRYCTDDISIILYGLAKAYHKQNDLQQVKEVYEEHRDLFGVNHPRNHKFLAL